MKKELITIENKDIEPVNTEIININLADRFISYMDVKQKSIDTYRRALKQFFIFMDENNIKQPTREDIIDYKNKMTAANKSASTIQLYLASVKQFFRWTEQEGIYKNIADHVKGVKPSSGYKKDYLPGKSVKEILEDIDCLTLQGKRDFAILSLMVTTGLRTIEVTRADISDLRIYGDCKVLYIQGKGHDEKDAFVKIDSHVEKSIKEYLKARPNTAGNQPLFASLSHNSQGGRMTTRSISRIVKTHLVNAGYDSDRLTAHSLRHTAATLNLLNGGTLEETQGLLRHQNINTTMIYAHLLDRAKNNSENRIATAIFS